MALTQGTPVTTTATTGDIHLAYTAMGGSNRKLVVALMFGVASSASNPVVSADLGGVALTPVGNSVQNGGSAAVYFYEVNNASDATINIQLTNSSRQILGYLEWSGADTSALTGFTGAGNSNTASVTATGTTSGNVVFAAFCHPDSETPPHTFNQTVLWDVNTGLFQTNGGGSYAAAGGSITSTESLVNVRDWAAYAVEVKAAPSGGGGGLMWLY